MAGSTHRVSDGSSVVWADAIAAWSAAARPELERVAATYGAYLTYAEFASAVQRAAGIDTAVPFRHWIGQVLGVVARSPRAPGEPMLSALVVHSDGTIGEGYGIPVAERDGELPDDLEAHAATERYECYQYFGAELPADGGRPMLTPQVQQRRARRRIPDARPPVCPNCFLQLPLSGQCDRCGVEA